LILTVVAVAAIIVVNCGDENPNDPGDGGDDGGIVHNPVDTIPPAAVSSILLKLPRSSKLTLQWFAPGDDGDVGQASLYDVRWSTAQITDLNWDAATQVDDVAPPKPAGQPEQITAQNLPSYAEIYFAIKTFDEVPNESDLSVCVSAMTTSEDEPPPEVDDLQADAIGDTEVLLTFTAPGDDGYVGTATGYDVRHIPMPSNNFNYETATQAVGDWSPKQSGAPDSVVVTGLEAGTNYYFALKTYDEVPNTSDVSNWAPALAMGNYILAIPSIVWVGQTTGVQIFFRTTAPSGPAKILITKLPWGGGSAVVFKHVVSGVYPAGAHVVTWDLTNDAGQPVTTAWGQLHAVLYWGTTPVDSVDVRIQQ
jgi:hypothetical protein